MPTIQIKATDAEVATLRERAEAEQVSVPAYIRRHVPELADGPQQGRPRRISEIEQEIRRRVQNGGGASARVDPREFGVPHEEAEADLVRLRRAGIISLRRFDGHAETEFGDWPNRDAFFRSPGPSASQIIVTLRRSSSRTRFS